MHLAGLFESGVLSFDEKLHIDLSQSAYERVKAWYMAVYKSLAKHYLNKKDAKLFLECFVKKEEGVYLPTSLHVKQFVDYYWALHQAMGREIDESVRREEWVCKPSL